MFAPYGSLGNALGGNRSATSTSVTQGGSNRYAVEGDGSITVSRVKPPAPQRVHNETQAFSLPGDIPIEYAPSGPGQYIDIGGNAQGEGGLATNAGPAGGFQLTQNRMLGIGLIATLLVVGGALLTQRRGGRRR